MRFELHHILKVEAANIEMGGLTVLTGENSSGKSTLGKTLFSLLKAVNNVRRTDKVKTIELLRVELLSIRRLFEREERVPATLDDVRLLGINLVDGALILADLRAELDAAAAAADFNARTNALMRGALARIGQYLDQYVSPESAFRTEFEAIARTEFREELASYEEGSGSIHFYDDSADAVGSAVGITITDRRFADVCMQGNTSFRDVTYVESSVYMNVLDALRRSGTFSSVAARQADGLPYHLTDMADKMISSVDLSERMLEAEFRDQLDHISGIVGGQFVLDDATKQLAFVQEGHEIQPVSVASGVKSFGVLQRLIENGAVSPSKLLIWDEPEIHLHPEWQVKFCGLLVDLVAVGIPIIVSTHSPYFLQGLRYFAAMRGIEREVRYYMAETNPTSGRSLFKEVTDDLNRVFALLAGPLHEIMNVDAVRRKRR
jgi:predicted ATPase